MSSRLASGIASRLLRSSGYTLHPHKHPPIFTPPSTPKISPIILPNAIKSQPLIFFESHTSSNLRFLSTAAARRHPVRSGKVDIGARARHLQNRRLWTYALTFSCIAGFIIIVLNQFQDQLVFYVTPSEVIEKHKENPTKTKFRLGGLVLEGSVHHPASSSEMEFVVTDLLTDILVRYQGSLPDLFREGHSVVVEGFVKPFTEEIRNEGSGQKGISAKARSGELYFSATEVLAKHDEKYMPKEVAAAIETNKKNIEAAAEEQRLAVKS